MRRRVLILAYFFPPNSSGGVVRTVKFVKYLADFNWACTIVAPDWGEAELDLSGFGGEIPESTEIVRAGDGLDSPWIWKTLDRVPHYWQAFRTIRAGLEYPDVFSMWKTTALPVLRRLLRENRHDLIFSTSPPVTSHFMALQLRNEFQVPWVADFRDPWTDNRIGYLNPWQWRRRIDLRLERRIYQDADVVVANTASNRETMISKHGVSPDKIVTITNGYDESDFIGCSKPFHSQRFRIVYTGSFYSSYNPRDFLVAFKSFLLRHDAPQAVFTVAGSACQWIRENVDDALLLSHIELVGHVSHQEACQLLVDSDMLLHVYPSGIPYSVPGKLYEYLRSGRPIVAICDRPSEVARILEETGRGRAFRHNEIPEMSDCISESYASWQQGDAVKCMPDNDRIQMYDRRNLSKNLADVFKQVLENGRNGSK